MLEMYLGMNGKSYTHHSLCRSSSNFFFVSVKGRIQGKENTGVCSGRQKGCLARQRPYGIQTKHILHLVHLIPLHVKDTLRSMAKKYSFVRPVGISPSSPHSSYDKNIHLAANFSIFYAQGWLTLNLYNPVLYANSSHPHKAAIHYLVVASLSYLAQQTLNFILTGFYLIQHQIRPCI